MQRSAKDTTTTHSSDAGRTALARGFTLFCVLAAVLGLQASAALALPGDRAYEMVSPPDKNNGDVGAGLTPGAYRASADGDRLAYLMTSAFGDAQSHTIATGYQATRGESFWSSTGTNLPMAPLTGITYMGPNEVSPDLSKVVVQTNMDLDSATELPAGQPYAWYLYDPYAKAYERITPPSPDGTDYELNKAKGAELIEGSDDFNDLYFTAKATLTTDAIGLTDDRTYRYADGELSLVSVLPGGTPSQGILASAQMGGGGSERKGVSRDGDIVFWNNGPSSAKQEIYRSDYSGGSAPDTMLVNESENTLEPVPVGPAEFMGASGDGSIAYLRSDQRLVDADTDSVADLYQWDASQPAGSRLTLMSSGGVANPAPVMWGVSENGKRAYFVHNGQLVPEAPADSASKLYAWDDGETVYIGKPSLSGNNSYNKVISPNGRYFGFVSATPGLTPENIAGRAQAFVYDLDEKELSCASCVPLPGASTQVAQFMQTPVELAKLTNEQRRNLTNDGEVYFDTVESLLPSEDTNGKRDVYAWKDGEVDLISGGRGAYDSFFADASAEGDSIFFHTFDRLVGWDVDDHSDLYAARVGGGFPEPQPDASCTGSGCLEPPALPPAAHSPGSATFQGGGNQAATCEEISRQATKAGKAARKLQRKAKRLKLKSKGKGTKQAKKTAKRRSKKVMKKAKKAKRSERTLERQLDRCEQGSPK